MKARCHVIISGKVQGVCFRSNTMDMATALRLNGWVRNLANGNVEAVFEGEKESISKVLDFCRAGPSSADVGCVEIKWEPCEDLKGFSVR